MAITEPADTTLTDADQQTLLRVAESSVRHTLMTRTMPAVDPARFAPALQQVRAAFVTLKMQGQLRGCIGSLTAKRPLVEDVAANAVAAAFHDPRFGPVGYYEIEQLHYHISVLSTPQPMTFSSEPDLIAQLRPGIDGLILEEPAQSKRGTFLPAVWDQIPDPATFLQHLRKKANLPIDYWSDTLTVSRYTAESVG